MEGFRIDNTGSARIGVGNSSNNAVLLTERGAFFSDGLIEVGAIDTHPNATGRINVETGSLLLAPTVVLGGGARRSGRLNVDGDVEIFVEVDLESFAFETVQSEARFSGQILVGGTGDLLGQSGGFGNLSVTSGGLVSGGSLIIGSGFFEELVNGVQSFTESSGTVSVSGLGTPNSDTGLALPSELDIAGQLTVGEGGGFGSLVVSDGGEVSSGELVVGTQAGQVGPGGGSVAITSGGSLASAGDAVIGSAGNISVSDAGSFLDIENDITIGPEAELIATNGGSVDAIRVGINPGGKLEVLQGASVSTDILFETIQLTFPEIFPSGVIRVGGTSADGISSTVSAEIVQIGTESLLVEEGGKFIAGDITFFGPEFELSAGSITSNFIFFDEGFGPLTVSGGLLRVGSTETFEVDLLGGRLETPSLPFQGFSHDGGVLAIDDLQTSSVSYTQGMSATLELTLDEEDAGGSGITLFDGGVLEGTLNIQLAEGYQPNLGDRFRLLTAFLEVGEGADGLDLGGQFGIDLDQASLPLGLRWETLLFTDQDPVFPDMEYIEIFVSEAPILVGDFDNDGDVDDADIDFYTGNLSSDRGFDNDVERLDLNSDQEITLADHEIHVTTLVETSNGEVGTLLGDINLDGRVDVLGDAFILVSNLNSSGSFGWADGDLNADGRVDVLGDAFRLVGNLGQSSSSSSP